MIGQSPAMERLFSIIERVAPTDASVLLTGATGTGKEVAARTIHDRSPRRNGPFVDINCSAIPETLIEAELFGHQRGTFTGATENRSGLFEKASGGTLFLDEVDALNLSAQAKLLRVLQERTVRRIGARANIAIDVRIFQQQIVTWAKPSRPAAFALTCTTDSGCCLFICRNCVPEATTMPALIEHFLKMKASGTAAFATIYSGGHERPNSRTPGQVMSANSRMPSNTR